MALNFSPRALYPAEGDLASSIRVADRFIGARMGNGFGRAEIEDSYGFLGRDRGQDGGGGGSSEPSANDILDLLPSDPFGMDLSATFTAIADWLQDFNMESGLDFNMESGLDFNMESGLNFFGNRAMVFGSENGSVGVGESPHSVWRFEGSGSFEEMETEDGSCDGEFKSAWDVEEILSFGDGEASRAASNRPPEETGERPESCFDGDEGAPHEALLLSLGSLEVRDLLSAERVCRSLRMAVHNDVLLWRNIHIDQPLNERITDHELLKLTGRAQGSLQSLSLVECPRITDDCLRRVLESNPRLSKLRVPGCTRLTIGGLLNSLKAFNSAHMPGIKCLRIGGLYGVKQEHFEELLSLLKVDKQRLPDPRKPRFFHIGHSLRSNDDECPIDIEICPRCQKFRLIYDCPVQSCQGKQNSAQQCRACSFCIARCSRCGRCVNNSEYEETFCLDNLCKDCVSQGE